MIRESCSCPVPGWPCAPVDTVTALCQLPYRFSCRALPELWIRVLSQTHVCKPHRQLRAGLSASFIVFFD